MTTQYQAPEQQDPRQYGQGQESAWEQRAWQQPVSQPAWQQPGQYAARRSTPWGVIMAVGAAVIVACTLALVFLFGHLAGPAQGGGTPASTSGSNQHTPVNPAVPTHPAVNPAVPTHPAG
jgi:hypothetical protein